MEFILRFIKAVVVNIAALIMISLLIAAAPVISIALLVAPMVRSEYAHDSIGWFVVACPFCVGIWYMFIATLTRLARSKQEGCTPRNGFFAAGLRLFGGWFWSQAAICAMIVILSAIFGNADGSSAMAAERIRAVMPMAILVVWSPVIVNVSRHFARRSNLKAQSRSNGTC